MTKRAILLKGLIILCKTCVYLFSASAMTGICHFCLWELSIIVIAAVFTKMILGRFKTAIRKQIHFSNVHRSMNAKRRAISKPDNVLIAKRRAINK